MKSPNTRNGFLGKRSIQGATNSGIKKWGINWIAITRADAKVLPVSSKTRNDNAKLPTIPPIHPKVVAAINREKFLVHKGFFIS